MGAERWDEQVGSVAEEASRLLEALRLGTEGPVRPGADRSTPGPADGPGPEDEAGATGCSDPFCQWCPLCRTVSVVRGLSPETLTRLADLAGAAAGVLADLAAARRAAGPAPGGAGPAEGDTPARAPRARADQPIPVRDAGPRPEEADRG